MRYLLLAAVLLLAGCVNNQGLRRTFPDNSGAPTPPSPPVPPLYAKPRAKTVVAMSPKVASMQRTFMAAPMAAPEPLSMSLSPLDNSNFLSIRVEGTNMVLSWPTNAWLAGAIPVWKTNLVGGMWRPVPNVMAQTNKGWRTTNGAMFEFTAPIRAGEARFFALSTNVNVNIGWNYDTNEIVTGFKLYTGSSPQTYTSVTSYTWQASWEGGTNFSAWITLPTTQTWYLSATAFLKEGDAGEMESDFSRELVIPEQR